MNRGLFNAQLNTAWDIIVYLNLDRYRIWFPDYQYVSVANFSGMTYLDIWKRCIKDQLYDFLLNDYSLIQFRVDSFRPTKVDFTYFECPFDCLSYEDFVKNEVGYGIAVVGDELIREYEDYIFGCSEKDTVTPLRYDYDPDRYQEARHPASHVHFGHANNIRVGTRKMLIKPLSFLLFVIRQCYPNQWATLLGHRDASTWCKNIRDNLVDVDGKYYGPKDQYEMVLH